MRSKKELLIFFYVGINKLPQHLDGGKVAPCIQIYDAVNNEIRGLTEYFD